MTPNFAHRIVHSSAIWIDQYSGLPCHEISKQMFIKDLHFSEQQLPFNDLVNVHIEYFTWMYFYNFEYMHVI